MPLPALISDIHGDDIAANGFQCQARNAGQLPHISPFIAAIDAAAANHFCHQHPTSDAGQLVHLILFAATLPVHAAANYCSEKLRQRRLGVSANSLLPNI